MLRGFANKTRKDRECRFCGRVFKNSTLSEFSNHVIWCKLSPNYVGRVDKRNNTNLQNTINKLGIEREFTVYCARCSKELVVVEREKEFPKKVRYFCSRSCANSRTWDVEHKKRVSEKMVNTRTGKTVVFCICMNCSKSFEVFKGRERKCCSGGCLSDVRARQSVARGLASAKVQAETRRSKNEKLFAEMCVEHFKEVKTNVSMFSGWDADVVIEDIKVAVLWNGIWHYEKITDKHSVEQVQNRDRLKIDAIYLCGYKPYIIKDMGSYDENFVKIEFNKFLIWIPSSVVRAFGS